MDLKKIAESLNRIERKVLAELTDNPKNIATLAIDTKLKEIEVMRGIQWLSNKNLVIVREELHEVIDIDSNGELIQKYGLPEKRLLKFIKSSGAKTFDEIQTNSGLSSEEIHLSMGVLKKKNAVTLSKAAQFSIEITSFGETMLSKESLEEKFINKKFPLNISSLNDEERYALNEFRKRKEVIKVQLKKEKICTITELGRDVSKLNFVETIECLDSEVIRSGIWKEKGFRRYDLNAPVPRIIGGKRQHYRKFLDACRSKFCALGFEEMTGPLVESNFWDMDVLFMPQFHSARDIHDAYYVKEPRFATDLPMDLVQNVKEAHENGFGTGSRGWQYKFDIEKTKQLLLRTQGTACSARMLASKNLKNPGKYFAIARIFRSDVVDATHNSEFFQTEGIVVGEGLNLRHLFGLLRMFAKEFANTEEIKITPCYYPFTEPSASLYAKHPDLGWIELAGAGIFRPEMMKPLGISTPVIAWGLGIDRLAMFKLGLKDIRDLFSKDLSFLRNSKVI